MKQIDEIISELTKAEGSLEPALLKTKVLAYKLDNKILIDWVDLELEGYPVENVPEYRHVPCTVYGVLTNGAWRHTHAQIPLSHLDKEIAQNLLVAQLQQGITGLEHLAVDIGGDIIISAIPFEMTHWIINKGIPTNGFKAESAQREFTVSSVKQVVTRIRSRLLNFMLQLNREVGENEISPEQKEMITELFQATIVGDYNVVIAGSNNVQNVKYKISVKDFADVRRELEKIGVEERDVQILQEVIDIDNPDNQRKIFGDKVKKWLKEMTGKAIDGTWNISIGAAGTILAEIIGRYYGWF